MTLVKLIRGKSSPDNDKPATTTPYETIWLQLYYAEIALQNAIKFWERPELSFEFVRKALKRVAAAEQAVIKAELEKQDSNFI